MLYSEIKEPVSTHLKNMDTLIAQHCKTDTETLKNMCDYMLGSQGKRIRPTLVLLTAQSFQQKVTKEHEKLAAIIELIHTATLLHDDVLDKSEKRRGKTTHHTIWGNHQAILLGDYIYALAFKIIAELQHPETTKILAQASCKIVESELLQSSQTTNIQLSKDDYFTIIQGKTATLFSAAMETSALISQTDSQVQWKKAGFCLGMAYQIIDDCLDYNLHNKHLDKNNGDDWFSSTPTLPIIQAYRYASPEEKTSLKNFFKNPRQESFQDLCHKPYLQKGLDDSQAIASELLEEFVTLMKSVDQDTTSLIQLASFLQQRKF